MLLLSPSSNLLKGICSWLTTHFFGRILPTSGHYICGKGFVVKTKENNRLTADSDIHHNEMCKCDSHVHAKAVLAFRQCLPISAGFICPALSMNRGFCIIATNLCQLIICASLSISDIRIWCLLSQFFFPPEPTWNLSYIRRWLNCDGFSWTSTVQIESKGK